MVQANGVNPRHIKVIKAMTPLEDKIYRHSVKKKLMKTKKDKVRTIPYKKDYVNEPYFHKSESKLERVYKRASPWLGTGLFNIKKHVHRAYRDAKDIKQGIHRDPFAGIIRTKS